MCFYMLRLCGQGTLTLVATNAINLWWEKRRGRIMGCCSFVNALCLTGLFSSVTKHEVAVHGWRLTYRHLGWLELCVVLPLGLLFIREKPEVYGLLPDGDAAEAVQQPSAAGDDEKPLGDAIAEKVPSKIVGRPEVKTDEEEPIRASAEYAEEVGSPSKGSKAARQGLPLPLPVGADKDFTFGEAVRTPLFWALCAGNFCIAALATALFFHIDTIFDQPELNKHVRRVYLTSAITAGLTNIAGGFVIDLVKSQLVLACSLFFNAMMLFATASSLSNGPKMLFAVGLLNGLSMGLFQNVAGVAFANSFGRTHNGKIQGLAQALTVLGSAVGPWIFSVGRSFCDSYWLILVSCAAWPAILSLCVAAAPSPERRT